MMNANRLPKANFFAAGLMASQLVLMFVFIVFRDTIEETAPFATGVAGLVIANELIAVLIPSLIFAYAFCRSHNEKIISFLRIKPLTGKNILLIISMSIFIQPFISIISAVSLMFFGDGVGDMLATASIDMTYLQMVAAVAVIPALFEELALRGAVLGAYGNELDERRTILINGLFFGMIHLNPSQLLYAAALGAFFAFIVIRTGSIFAGIISHFTINFTQVTLLNAILPYMSEGYEEPYMATDLPMDEAVALGMAVFIGISIYIALLTVSIIVFFRLFKRFSRINPQTGQFARYDEPDDLYADETEKSESETADDTESPLFPEIDNLKFAIENKSRFSLAFIVSFVTVVTIYMGFMLFSGKTPLQLVLLLCIFAAFFFVLFLFRIRR